MGVHSQFDEANERGRERQATVPRAVAAYYDRNKRRVVIGLSSNVELSFSPNDAQGLEAAAADDLAQIEISPSGFGLHFPRLDTDLYLPAILEGVLGTKKWMAARLGQAGGRSRSAAKLKAARANGKLGGRPKRKREAAA